MSIATMTSKGQITVPKEVRELLRLETGSKVMFVHLGGGHIRVVARTGKIQDLAGILHKPGRRALTIEEINEGIAEGAVESGMRGLRPGDS